MAALAHGVGVKPCVIIVGPGNQCVTAAKSIVNGLCGRSDFGLKVWEAMSTTKFTTQDDEPAICSFSKESSVGRHSAESDTTLTTLHMFVAGIL